MPTRPPPAALPLLPLPASRLPAARRAPPRFCSPPAFLASSDITTIHNPCMLKRKKRAGAAALRNCEASSRLQGLCAHRTGGQFPRRPPPGVGGADAVSQVGVSSARPSHATVNHSAVGGCAGVSVPRRPRDATLAQARRRTTPFTVAHRPVSPRWLRTGCPQHMCCTALALTCPTNP